VISAAALALAALAAVASPKPPGAPAPVRVDADEVHYAFQKREMTFTGKDAKLVTMTRADARLSCRKLVARTDDGGQIVSAACTGDVRFTRGDRVVTCDRATFDAATERVICEGNPVLKDAASEVRAARLVYELRTDEARAEGAQITLPGDEVEARRKALEERRKERPR
jgi:lipopolysaccharide export system protein LptA